MEIELSTTLLKSPTSVSRHGIAYAVRSAFDPWLVIPALTIYAISLLALYSVVYHPVAFEINPSLSTQWSTPFTRQILWGMIGVSVMTFLAFVSTNTVEEKAWSVYGASVLLLIVVLVIGTKVRNIRAWISLGPLRIQPSEMAKIGIILASAYLFTVRQKMEKPISLMIQLLFIVGVPALLVLKQPDMGTVIIYSSLLFVMPFAAGMPVRYFIVVAVSILIALTRLLVGIADQYMGVIPRGIPRSLLTEVTTGWYVFAALVVMGIVIFLTMKRLRIRHSLFLLLVFVIPATAYVGSFQVSNHLRDYQKLRIFSFMAPQMDPRGSGYNLIQSEIAFGSGGMMGKGVSGATQSTLGFLPERQTDFIFSVIGEIFGFAGAALVILAFTVLILRMLWIASKTNSQFGSLVAIGTATVVASHVLVNAGMTLGLAPIMGIPLPFSSYGGSSLVTMFALLGLVMGVQRELRT